jgi:DNA polymerase-1
MLMEHGVKNPASGKQISKFVETLLDTKTVGVYERTSKGDLKTTAEILDQIAQFHPEVGEIVDYKQLQKAVSSWLLDLYNYSAVDGRIHPRLAPFGTASFRMSCSDINMQALPMKDRHKAFEPLMGVMKSDRPGQKLYAVDIKQAEVRVAAIMAPDDGLAEMFAKGGDPYINMAIKVWDDPKRRDDAKRAVLSAIYEIGATAFSTKYKVAYKDAEKVLKQFRGEFPKIKDASRYWENQVLRNSYVPLMDGRKRWFGPAEETYKAYNQVIQGSVSEMMQWIMLEVEYHFPGRLILQIHDSLIMHLPEDDEERKPIVDKIREIIKASMPEDLLDRTNPRVPILADVDLWE